MISRIVIINDASTARGGATGLALASAKSFRSLSIPVTLIAGDSGENSELLDLGVEIVPLAHKTILSQSRLSAAVAGIRNAPAMDLVSAWIKDNDNENTIYHVHGWSKVLSPSIFQSLRAVASRTFIHAHDFFMACPNGGFVDYTKNEICLRRPLGLDCLTTNCDKRSYPQKLWRVARQVGLNNFLGSAEWAALLMIHEKMAPFFERSGYPPELLKTLTNPAVPFNPTRIPVEENDSFFYVGRLEKEKGIQDVITAAALASVKLEVVGEGPLRSQLEAEYPHVKFHGWQSREQIGNHLTRARALVLASRYPEPFGLVVAEASLSGLPVILTDTAFLADDVVKNGIGFSSKAMNPEDLAHAIRHVAQLPLADIRSMSIRAHGGEAKLALTQSQWVERLLENFKSALVS